MKVHHKKFVPYINLFIAIVWLLNGTYYILTPDSSTFNKVNWFVISALYFSLFAYQKYGAYIISQDGYIKANSPFSKKIQLSEIVEIKKFAGDYILKTKKKKMTLNLSQIQPESIEDLTAELEKLDVKWT